MLVLNDCRRGLTNLPNSPAMLITRQSGRLSCALALLDVKDDVHR